MIHNISWPAAISQLSKTNEAWVMATVLGTRGSSPRDASSKMIVTKDATYDTIGGGQFEFQVIQRAREILSSEGDEAIQEITHFPLAAKTNQCCGGTVSVLMESFAANTNQIDIFGAGHVAHALVPILAKMKVSINWVDSRKELFSDQAHLPSNVRCIHIDDPLTHCQSMSANSIALVLTHDHSLDYKLICSLLDRKDTRFIGLIGSKTKAMRFNKRLRSESFTEQEVMNVHCPVGLNSIPGKQPIEIAISIAAQITQLLHSQEKNSSNSGSGFSWRQLNKDLQEQMTVSTEARIIL